MFAMLTGRLPFTSSNVTTLHALMLDQKYETPDFLTDGARGGFNTYIYIFLPLSCIGHGRMQETAHALR